MQGYICCGKIHKQVDKEEQKKEGKQIGIGFLFKKKNA